MKGGLRCKRGSEVLQSFLSAFSYRSAFSEGKGEFDHRHPEEAAFNLLSAIVNNPSCVDASVYPGKAPVEHWDAGSDPKGWKDELYTGYLEFDQKKAEWIATKIFHRGNGAAGAGDGNALRGAQKK